MKVNQKVKISLQGIGLAALTLPASASAGPLARLEADCQCFLKSATLSQTISLGIMMILVTGVFVLKWMERKTEQGPKPENSQNDSAIQTLRELKIGSRFSELAGVRLEAHRRPVSTR